MEFPGETKITHPPPNITHQELYKMLLYRNVMPGSSSSAIVRKQCFETVGQFDESLIASEDRDMWIRLATKYLVHFIDLPLTVINQKHFDSMSKNIERMAKGYEQFIEKRRIDIQDEYRYLLPRAERYNYLRVARSYFVKYQMKLTRRYVKKALSASLYPDKELRRLLLLLGLSFVSPKILQGCLSPIYNRIAGK
jgi:hypothetical protein